MAIQNKFLNKLILVLTLSSIGSLLISSTSVIIETTLAHYLWYVALVSMSSLLSLWVLMLLMLAAKMCIQWYKQTYNHENEVMHSWEWLRE